ncbi:MAG: transcriptional regulator [Planctomycetaceae bacterium]|nr:transcriptional regulator [Planctomycetaceae bacterium]
MSKTSNNSYHLGFDLGGTKMLAVVYDAQFKAIGRSRMKTQGSRGTDSVLERLTENIEKALSESGITSAELSSIGIGVPGTVNMENGIVLGSVNLGWKNIPIVKILQDKYHCSVQLLNDVDAGVYGESQFGSGRGATNVLGVFPGTGIGGGAILNGKIVTGSKQTSMEIGHVPVVPNGTRCGCGLNGCLETVASRLAISGLAAQAAYRGAAPYLRQQVGTDISLIRSGVLAAAVANGDTEVEAIIKRACKYLGKAIGAMVTVISPDIVILGGGLAEAMPDLFTHYTSKAARKSVVPILRDTFEIKIAELGDDASVLGAAVWGASAT